MPLSLDPSCLAAYLYLQLQMSGSYKLAYCTNPDESPSGQLPFLTHGQHSISGLQAILKFVNQQVDKVSDPDALLSIVERAQSVARTTQIQSDLGDLTAYTYYALSTNWYGKTRPVLVSALSIPQRYYVPGRLRKSHQPRLEAAGLWHAHDQEGQDVTEGRFTASFEKLARKKDAKDKKDKTKGAIEKERVLSKARLYFDVYAKLLENKRFFHEGGDRPSTLDIIFAAHIILLKQPLPDSSIAQLLQESYPILVSHANTVYNLAFPDANSFPAIAIPSLSIRSLFPRPFYASSSNRVERTVDTEEETRFARWRWAFFSVTTFVIGSYVYSIGIVPALIMAFQAQQQRLEELEQDEVDSDEDKGWEYGGEGEVE